MKSLNYYITEKLKIRKYNHNYFPETKTQLKTIILKRIQEEGNNVDLNDIDTSKITDMSALFYSKYLKDFCGDISEWNVSNVTNMNHTFSECTHFNCDLSKWNVSKVTNMCSTFYGCSEFEGKGLDTWDVSQVENMEGMFGYCQKLKGYELENWNIQKVKSTIDMFYDCKELCCNLDNWKPSSVKEWIDMFEYCDKLTLPKWYKK